jgi:hypothetical protein
MIDLKLKLEQFSPYSLLLCCDPLAPDVEIEFPGVIATSESGGVLLHECAMFILILIHLSFVQVCHDNLHFFLSKMIQYPCNNKFGTMRIHIIKRVGREHP